MRLIKIKIKFSHKYQKLKAMITVYFLIYVKVCQSS